MTARPAPSFLERTGTGVTLRFALRDLRGGVRGFAVFIVCIALGVMSIAAVGSLSQSLVAGLAREGRVILGGDVSFSLVQREARADERAFMDSRGRVSVAAIFRAMARAPSGNAALAEIKSVDSAYPLFGRVTLSPELPMPSLLEERAGHYGAAVDPALLARLDLNVGDRIAVGDASLDIRAVLQAEPDRIAGGIAFAPRILMSDAALRASGLVQPGSLVRWQYRLRLPQADAGEREAAAVAAEARTRFPDAGWDIRTRANASPELGRNIERFTQYLTIVGLTALLVGGVGVANAVKSYLDRRREVIATLKSVGATGGRVFAIYLTEVTMLAAFGATIGIALGAILPFAVAGTVGALIPIPLAPSVHLGELLLAGAYGVLTALAFTLWPLGRAHDVPVSALFRDEVAPERRWPRRRYMFGTLAAVVVLAALAVLLAYDRMVAAIFVAAAAAVFAGLRLIAAALMALARRAPRPRSTLLRLVLANIHRPGALTPSVVLSLGLGLAVLVTLTLIDGNLRREFTAALPDRAPAFYFVDIQSADLSRFLTFTRERAPGAMLQSVPMLRGRIVEVNGQPAETLHPPPNVAWALQSDRGVTYTDDVPEGSRVVAGTWWSKDYTGPPLISMESEIARGLGLDVGGTITVNVLGRNIKATVANLRAVDWQSLGINFVLVYAPSSFRGAPHANIATLTFPAGSTSSEEVALFKAVADSFPAITIVRVKEALEAVGKLVTDLAFAIRCASAVTLLSAVLVLAGALATGHRHRVYDAVILKTLGATRGRLLAAYAFEYLLIGSATALFGVVAGSISAYLILTRLMKLDFVWLPGPALLAALGALLLTVAFGLIGTFSALGQKPAAVLRHL